ncbi:MAG: hypothetical protein U1F10_08730 [Burkholderiales bacterium]
MTTQWRRVAIAAVIGDGAGVDTVKRRSVRARAAEVGPILTAVAQPG